jgi:hypothetical protein
MGSHSATANRNSRNAAIRLLSRIERPPNGFQDRTRGCSRHRGLLRTIYTTPRSCIAPLLESQGTSTGSGQKSFSLQMCGEKTCAKMCGFPLERATCTSDGRQGRAATSLFLDFFQACFARRPVLKPDRARLSSPVVSRFVSQAPHPYPNQSVFGSIIRYQFESTGPVENPHQLYLFVSLRLLRSLVIRVGVKI